MKKYDAVVIGSGMGGRNVAAEFAHAGKQVLLIEKRPEMLGGVYMNLGGIPTKSLIYRAQHSARQGGMFLEQARRYTTAIQEKDILVASLREECMLFLENENNITLKIGTASFAGEHLIKIQSGEQEEIIRGEKIFIDTGSIPIIPDIEGIRDSHYVYTSTSILNLKELPKKIVIIGGGYLGLEFASIYNNFGSEVTIIERENVILPSEDEEIVQEIKKSFLKRSITVMFSSTVRKIEEVRGRALLHVKTLNEEELLYADAVLITTGRKPNVMELNLRGAGIELAKSGGIRVDEYLHTTAPGVWALGDVTGGERFHFLAQDDARILRSQLLGDKKRTVNNRGQIPYCVFVDPAFSRIGLTEKEARGRGFSVKIARMREEESPKSRLLCNHWGISKAVIDAKTDKLLGIHLFSVLSYETINLAKTVMDAGLPYTVLRDSMFTHPSMSESFNHLFKNLET